MTTELLINQLFAGGYLDEGENIGHEVINFFKDDNGNHNLFITKSGKVSGHKIENILFVRHIDAKITFEVIGMAKGISTIKSEEIKNITYSGFKLEQIFRSNTYHGEKDTVTTPVTFRTRNFFVPLNRIFITLDDNFRFDGSTIIHLESDEKVLVPQSMRRYFSDNTKEYQQLLNKLINDTSLWNENNVIDALILDGMVHNQPPSFLEVIKKNHDENIFSNLISYFFEYSHSSFQKFAAESNLLNIKNMSADFELIREKTVSKVTENDSDKPLKESKERIDIWIESDKDIIVIENKIKSGINGIVSKDQGKQSSQLNSYYKYAEYIAKKSGKEAHFYIFAPNYAKFDLTDFGDDIKDNFKIISYSDIYNFFIQESATYIADRTFPDFVRGLKRHTLSLSEFQFDIMRTRLLRRISQL